MKMIFVLIILALILLCVAIVVFFWAVKQRQFDDLDVHAYSVLTEDNFENISTIDCPNTVESTSKTPE